MKHLSKSAVLWLLIAALLLCACQPTPEEDVVVNKAEGALESVISGDPAEVYAIDSIDGTAETLRDALPAQLLSISRPPRARAGKEQSRGARRPDAAVHREYGIRKAPGAIGLTADPSGAKSSLC